jgi:hypothetical protein
MLTRSGIEIDPGELNVLDYWQGRVHFSFLAKCTEPGVLTCG